MQHYWNLLSSQRLSNDEFTTGTVLMCPMLKGWLRSYHIDLKTYKTCQVEQLDFVPLL